MSFTIKHGSYCPVCRGRVQEDCQHTMRELHDKLACDAGYTVKNTALQSRLAHIADIAHAGGLARLTTEDAMTFIRRLTIQHWNKTGYEDAMRDRVLDAARAADSASVNHRGQNGGDLSGMADSAVPVQSAPSFMGREQS